MEQTRPATPWYRSPLWLAALGLALMVGGYQLSRYVPLTPREQEQADRLADLHGKTDDEVLKERIDAIARNARRDPPFRVPGLITVLIGAMLFVSAAVMMFRQPARPAEPTPSEPHGEEDVNLDRPA
jgi:hypothetical protein